ncbi:MAG: DoxX family protein [Pyrinomonadaceae bacterium]|nr:DoxX family protein [Pyrinomonadaceae bacterium]
MVKKLLFGGERDLSLATNLGITLLRIFAGFGLLYGHGIDKVRDPSGIIGFATKTGFPLPWLFGWAAALSEFLGAGLLIFGLLTRVSSFFIACTMLTGFLFVHLNDPFAKQEKVLLYLFVALLFLIKGSGDWSVDALISKRN